MPSRSESRWRGPALDGLAVLVAILIAFGIDALWQESSERATEDELLIALDGELADARQGLTAHLEDLKLEISLNAEVLQALSAPQSRDITDDSLVAISRRQAPPSLYYPPRAALDDLTSSGGIVLVQSNPLRRAIASYERSLALDRQIQDILLDLWLVHLAPYMYEHSTLSVSTEVVEGIDSALALTRPALIDRNAYLGSRTYQNLVSARVLRIRDVRVAHQGTLEALDLVMELLER